MGNRIETNLGQAAAEGGGGGRQDPAACLIATAAAATATATATACLIATAAAATATAAATACLIATAAAATATAAATTAPRCRAGSAAPAGPGDRSHSYTEVSTADLERVHGLRPHPGTVVESPSLGAVKSPKLTYKHMLADHVIKCERGGGESGRVHTS